MVDSYAVDIGSCIVQDSDQAGDGNQLNSLRSVKSKYLRAKQRALEKKSLLLSEKRLLSIRRI